MHELPPPIVVVIDGGGGAGFSSSTDWTSFYTPAATWPRASLPVVIAGSGAPPPGSDASAFDVAIALSTAAWGLPACSSARLVAGSTIATAPATLAADGKNEIIVHTSDWPATLKPLALAQTLLFTSGTDIVEADIHVNAHDWSFSASAGGAGGAVWDLRAVLTHELGHVMGLGHSADDRATMYAGLPSGLAARSLEADDIAGICALYPTSLWPTAPSVACDRTGSCPTGTRCVGHACEWAGEVSTLGEACAPEGTPFRCAAAGDTVDCIATSEGPRCAASCGLAAAGSDAGAADAGGSDAECGAGLWCARISATAAACLPAGAGIAASDAGVGGDAAVDAASDGASDAVTTVTSTTGRSGCAMSHGNDAGAIALLPLALLLAQRRRRPLPAPPPS